MEKHISIRYAAKIKQGEKKMMKETVIFSLTSSVELTKEICDYLNLPVGNVQFGILQTEKF